MTRRDISGPQRDCATDAAGPQLSKVTAIPFARSGGIGNGRLVHRSFGRDGINPRPDSRIAQHWMSRHQRPQEGLQCRLLLHAPQLILQVNHGLLAHLDEALAGPVEI
jgi:hypothetical protein